MLGLLGFDPLQVISEVVIIGIVVIALAFTWRHRHRVMMAITGDDRIHGTSLDFIWFTFFRCCGLCTGDWTRCLSTLPCCPKRIRGTNLLNSFGQCLGLITTTVELKNIVVGDLPYNQRGDFYLVVECSANPPVMSSLAEEKHPKVVHFPEIITCRLRWSPLEEPLRITVRELDVLGSKDICRCHLSAMSVLDWADDPHERMKRFEMKPMSNDLVHETPAWILVEFDQPSEARDLEHFHGNVNTVRTSTRDGHYQDTQLAKFKRSYVLVDGNGHAMDEPLEEDLQEVACLRSVSTWSQRLFVSFLFLLIVAYLVYRAYTWSCYRQYSWLTMAHMRHAAFPISTGDLLTLVAECNLEVQGTGVDSGIPCRPNRTNIMGLCRGGQLPAGQPRPKAFAALTSERLGIELGIQCVEGICDVRNFLVQWDVYIVSAFAALVLLSCACKACSNSLIRHRKIARQHERLEQKTRAYERMNTDRGTYF